ncbi:MAG: response regulator [Desulfovibrio sp.]|jgi:CheY-like chemotaxis protein|nr:response regulator [Desulfovibrio sp.]
MEKKKVALVIDDEADVRAYLQAVLEDCGFDVHTAADGLTGFDAATALQPDLITLDISMPDQSGVRTYRQLKTDETLKKIPVFIITGFSDKMRIFLKKLATFPFPEAFINKPVHPGELRKMITEQFSGESLPHQDETPSEDGAEAENANIRGK